MTETHRRRGLIGSGISVAVPWVTWFSQRRFAAASLLIGYEASIVVLLVLTLRSTGRAVLPNSAWDTLVPFLILGAISLLVRLFVLFRAVRHRDSEPAAASHGRITLNRLAGDTKGVCAIVVLLVLCYLAVVAPLITGDPMVMVFSNTLRPPSAEHLFGTDLYGRDIFSRIAHGARYTLGIGVTATVLNILLGTTLGMIAGFARGVTDAIIMRILEILNSIPFLMLAILIIAVFGSSIPMLIVVLSVFVLQPARIVRGQVLELREKDFVQAALALGATPARVLSRHILPNVLSTVLVVASIRVGQNILSLAGLSFLGMGIAPPTPSWGSMLQEGRAYIQGAPWLGIFPGAAIFITVLAFNLFGDSLRDALDPRLRGSA
jgi:peptide/nickel transport system permease protein